MLCSWWPYTFQFRVQGDIPVQHEIIPLLSDRGYTAPIMTIPRTATPTITFIDEYCARYQELFPDVRSFEQFKLLHVGLLADLPRKSLPAIAKAVGQTDAQALHHFLSASPWSVDALRQRRLDLIKQVVGDRPLTLCIDETGDRKKGSTTDYVARQYCQSVS